MAKRIISEDTYNQWRINRDNKTWTLEQQATISVDDEAAVDVTVTSTGNTLKLLGDISATGDSGQGVHVSGAATKISIGTQSTIEANVGIVGEPSADGLRIVNRGEIDAAGAGIISSSDTNIWNFGEISGEYGVIIDGEGKVINGRNGVIHADTTGVVMTSLDSTLINRGEISAGNNAVYMTSVGDNKVINTGSILGDIVFGNGDDLLDSRKGTIEGDVTGGDGNDVYRIGKNNIDIIEEAGEGYDSVYSKVTHSLDDYVESLHLVGKNDAGAFGNAWDNAIFGNKGDNTLSGGGGDDYLGGGRGDDNLDGGDGDDAFMFNRNDDHDVVNDFAKGEDLIWMTGFEGVDTFGELQSHISQHGDDVWISMGQGDRLIIREAQADELEASDFSFLVL
jgi:hypothetical protein